MRDKSLNILRERQRAGENVELTREGREGAWVGSARQRKKERNQITGGVGVWGAVRALVNNNTQKKWRRLYGAVLLLLLLVFVFLYRPLSSSSSSSLNAIRRLLLLYFYYLDSHHSFSFPPLSPSGSSYCYYSSPIFLVSNKHLLSLHLYFFFSLSLHLPPADPF